MITNLRPDAAYFHALIEFERDLPLPIPAASHASAHSEAFGDLRRVLRDLDAGSAQSPESGGPLAGTAPRGSFSVFSARRVER